jgi:superfamily I DNA/RNA helicase
MLMWCELLLTTMPDLIGKQQEVVCLSTKGHHVVLGSAGSGKTTMAVYRAIYLSKPKLPGSGKTLIITYNKALMRHIASMESLPVDGVTVENYHRFARGYLNARGLMGASSIVGIARRKEFIQQAVTEIMAANDNHAFFHRHIKFFSDEVKWIAGHNIPSGEAYVEVTRTGRAAANLSRALRPLMWQVFERYRELRRLAGRPYDLDDIATAVSQALDSDTGKRLYRHIIIDEGQDMSPEMLRSLSKAVPADGSITFFGDMAQQIYGRGMSWRSAGLHPLKIWEFQQNYRNTISIAKLGLAISQMPYYDGLADMVEPIFSAADGPKPALVRFTTENDELKAIVALAKERAKTRSVVILLRTYAHIEKIKSYLPGNAIFLKEDSTSWSTAPGLSYGTYHSAKGLEFEVVFLPFMGEEEIPSPSDIETDGLDEALAQDGRLLYVGVTRAKSELLITYTGTVSLLLPADKTLYTEANR